MQSKNSHQGHESIVNRTNEYAHVSNEQDVSCCETKAGIKKRARKSQDTSRHIVCESVQIISEGTALLPSYKSLTVLRGFGLLDYI